MIRSGHLASALISRGLSVGLALWLHCSVLGQDHQQQPAPGAAPAPSPPTQEPAKRSPQSIFASGGPDGQQQDRPEQPVELSSEQAAEVSRWIESLASKEFAERERAAGHLLNVGKPVLPQLRQLAANSPDAEVRLRAGQIVDQLTHDDLQVRIEDFLSGKEVNFEGWRVTRAILGNSNAIRELFVEMLQAHPGLAASMEGTPRDRAVAMKNVVGNVKKAMSSRFPTRSDAFALLLPTVDPNVPINAAFDEVLLNVLRTRTANEIRKDALLSAPFQILLSSWIVRSTISSREDVLMFGMEWGIESTLPLAIQTLDEAQQTETLAIALQAIARFGSRDEVEIVRPLLDDVRPATERRYARGDRIVTQLGDVAMATIALIHKMPLSDAGFGKAEMHPTFGFILTDIGFPIADPEPRKKARAKIQKLLQDTPTPEES